MGKHAGKNIRKSLSSKYSQKSFGQVKPFTTDALKITFLRVIPKTATGNLIGNRITDKLTKVSNTLQQNNSETVKTSPKDIYVSSEERQEIIDDLRLI